MSPDVTNDTAVQKGGGEKDGLFSKVLGQLGNHMKKVES